MPDAAIITAFIVAFLLIGAIYNLIQPGLPVDPDRLRQYDREWRQR